MHPIDIPMQAAHLWLRAADLGVRAAILPVQLSARAASGVLDRLSPGERPAAAASVPVPVTKPAPAPAPRSTRAKANTKAKAKAPSRREVHPEPAPGLAEVHVAEPWEGYAALSAAEVVDRLADADETLLAVVRLYEGANEGREAVLHATER
jgi:hypothetical protein